MIQLGTDAAGDREVRAAATAALRREAGEVGDMPHVTPSLANRMRLAELLAEAPGLPEETREPLVRHRDLQRRHVLRQVQQLHRMHDLLADAGIRWMSIKGPVLAVLTTGSMFARGHSDIDVLVHPDDVPRLHTVLEEAGWPLMTGQPVPGDTWAWRHVRRTYYESTYRGPTGEIDVHWRLDAGMHSLPSFEECWADRQTVELAGVRVETLSPRHTLQHACSNSAKDWWRKLLSLVDIHRMASRPDLGEFALRDVDRLSLAVVDRLLPLPPSTPPWVRSAVADTPAADVQRALALRLGPDRTGPGRTSSQFAHRLLSSTDSVGDTARILWGVLLPANVVADQTDRHAITGVPRAVLRRGRQLPARLRRR